MLLGFRSFSIAAIGIDRQTWRIDAPGLWIRLQRQRGLGGDDRLLNVRGHGRPLGSRSLVAVMLDGHGVGRHGDRTVDLGRGETALLPGHASYAARIEPEEEQFSLTIEFDRAKWGGAEFSPQSGRVGEPKRVAERAEELCVAIEGAWAQPTRRPAVDRALADLLSALRADGLPIPEVDLRSFAAAPPPLANLARALDRSLSTNDSRSMLIDVEGEATVSARTIQRALPTLCALWGQRTQTFREIGRLTTLERACGAMTNPRATTELVARALGFSTPNAFCRAMNTFGLPSPGRVRERFLAVA